MRVVLSFALFALLTLSGCTIRLAPSTQEGVIKSIDGGENWKARSILDVGDGRRVRLSQIDVSVIKVHPSKSDSIFLGTRSHGLFASENGAASWTQLIPSQTIVDVELDPFVRCTLYVMTPQRLYRTLDCGDNWEVMYQESRPHVGLSSIVLDYSRGSMLYMTTRAGDLFGSSDGGVTWAVLYRTSDGALERVVIDRAHPSVLYLALRDGNQVFRSRDGGRSWTLISESLKNKGLGDFRNLVPLSGREGVVYAAERGIVRSTGDDEWETLELLSPSSSSRIGSFDLHPINDDIIYYTTQFTLLHTLDGGKHWRSKPIPATRDTRGPSLIVIDKATPAIVYLGFERKEKKSLYWY